jgi:hypothetical protein
MNLAIDATTNVGLDSTFNFTKENLGRSRTRWTLWPGYAIASKQRVAASVRMASDSRGIAAEAPLDPDVTASCHRAFLTGQAVTATVDPTAIGLRAAAYAQSAVTPPPSGSHAPSWAKDEPVPGLRGLPRPLTFRA